MSVESDNTVLHGVTPPNSEQKPKPLKRTWKRLKPKPKLDPVLHEVTRPNSEPKPKRDWSNPKVPPNRLKPELIREPILVRNLPKEFRATFMNEQHKDLADYYNTKRSPYDAILPPIPLYGGNPVVPVVITDGDRPLLKKFCDLALESYNNKEGASFEFHDAVKCTMWSAGGARQNLGYRVHYITFQAKAKGDTSSDITDFQAAVSIDRHDKDKPPVVEECRIKI